jgi:hypothetical protein
MVASVKSYRALARLHRVRRRLVDGRVVAHWYHRPTKIKLPAPEDPAFDAAYATAEQQWAAQQAAHAQPTLRTRNPAPPIVPTEQPQHHSPTAPEQPRSLESVTRASLNRRPGEPSETVPKVVRRRASVSQAEIARVIRAAKQAGASQIEVRLSDSAAIVVRLEPDNSLDSEEIIL